MLWSWNLTMMTAYGLFPVPRLYPSIEYPSACANGYEADRYGYACPHLSLFSDDMVSAARHDALHPWFVYGTAGSSTDEDCGKCYQVQLLDAERVWRDDFPFLVLQIINSGYDVMPYQFDVYTGAGGFGYYTSCNSDCATRFCRGGPCRQAMFSTPFQEWTEAAYEQPNDPCYSGGIKWLEDPDKAVEKCRAVFGEGSPLLDSCIRSNHEMLHQNFVEIQTERVRCPPGLYMASGLLREDDEGFPPPSRDLYLSKRCRGDRAMGHYCITTMQDCCKPSCAWKNKGAPSPEWSRVDSCDRDGSIYDYPS